jgi:hypothetical protein
MGLRLQLLVAWSLAFGILAGCGAHNGLIPVNGPASVSATAPNIVANCKGQKTTKTFASDSNTLKSTGGLLCVPTFGGFSGTIAYPPANPSVIMKLVSSTTNYNKKLLPLGPSTESPIFYLQLSIAKSTAFGPSAPAGGGLSSKALKASQTYTAYGQAEVNGFPVELGSCYLVARKGKNGGVIAGIGTLLKGQTVPAGVRGLVEIYAGKQSSSKC